MSRLVTRGFSMAILGFVAILGQAGAAERDAAGTDCPGCIADFALYDASYEDDGVWEEEVTAFKALFRHYGFTYKIVTFTQINQGYLGSGSNRKFRGLIETGGYAYYRNVIYSSTGESYIRSFVNSGGNYIGMCAGAWLACKSVSWDNYGTGNYQTYPYDLKLFNGTGKGPFGWIPWENGTNINYSPVTINTGNATMKKIGLPSKTRFVYGGGPWFIPSGTPSKYEIWGKALAPSGATNKDGNGQPAIIKFAYGKGAVILFAFHPTILINSTVDDVVLSQYYKENQIDWETGTQTFDQINLDSYQIMHASLQILANKAVTKITKLPND